MKWKVYIGKFGSTAPSQPWARLWAIVLAILIISFSTPSSILAQTSSTQTATIKIGVAAGLTIYVDRNLSFGSVVSGTGVDSVAITSTSAGHVTIGGSNKTVYVTLTPPSSLTSGSNTIVYTPRAGYNSSVDDPSTATSMSPSGQTSFKLNTHVTGNNYQGYVYLYGSINVGSVPAGSYSGTYTVAVTY